ncbi:MAG: HlyC/CorC family transporter [Betaproteobacteria bacterium]|nr:HlyC/CorC family transporter [Betaproteobacteria bacterium]MSQ88396.1 HlyC/CorC family transporter [Betaproteobacteria bacterium]
MDDIPLVWAIGALVALLAVSAFFSIAETSMMALNRYRLKHLAAEGHRGALRAAALLKHTDRLLGTVLIGNNLVNTAVATLSSLISIRLIGEGRLGWAVTASTVAASFLIVVFAEITPKVIGATYPERIAFAISWLVKPAQWLLTPGIWLVNLFVQPMLKLLRIKPDPEAQRLSAEEIRTLVLESSSFMPKKHLSILINLFDLGEITVHDVMVPRARIEAIRLDDDLETIARQLATSYYRELPVFRGGSDEIAGVLHLRKVFGQLLSGTLDKQAIEAMLDEPYFVSATTPAIAQLQYFQDKRERIGLVVDEYGELMGLVTLEGIVEEIIGKFTTSLPSAAPALSWDADGAATTDGATAVREVNRSLGLELPTDGPKTLNGLILEHLQDIPEANISIKIAGVPIEILSAQGRAVKSVRLFRPPSGPAPGAA